MSTTIVPLSPANHLHLLRQAQAALAPGSDVAFRHHGIGVLQGYLTEHTRVHVWHPALELPGMLTSGGIHDHRFAMTSHVLVGALHHDEHTLEQDPAGTWQLYEVVHAKIAARENYPAPTMVGGRVRYRAAVHPTLIGAGSAYVFDKRLFHRSWSETLVVTLVHKQAQEDRPARLLAPWGASVQHAFGERDEAEQRTAASIRKAAHEAVVWALKAAGA